MNKARVRSHLARLSLVREVEREAQRTLLQRRSVGEILTHQQSDRSCRPISASYRRPAL